MSDTGMCVEEYVDESGHCAFGVFFDRLSVPAAAKVTGLIEKMAHGHMSGLKSVGGGVAEWRLDWGPGVRVYIHRDGHTLLLLLGGSYGKAAQHTEIAAAQALVVEYKRRKKLARHARVTGRSAGHSRGGHAP